MTPTLNSKNEVTIPKEFQELLDLGPGSHVQFTIRSDGCVVVTKADAPRKGRRIGKFHVTGGSKSSPEKK